MRIDNLHNAEQARSVQAMFRRIAPHYDLMNRLMTGGQDLAWRKMVIHWASIPPHGRVLDLGAGTGDLAREALRQKPECEVIAADFTLQMMLVGKQQHGGIQSWSGADALNLPFPDNTFDALISGFLLRNVVDLQQALKEQYRVLKPGGRLVALDTTRPKPSLFSPFIRFHMRQVIPFLGGLLTGSRDAYVYLPSTSENFLWAEDLKTKILAAGFEQALFKRLMFGTIAIHRAKKPAQG
ncbi:MAG: ubiquinone/menaquinone biosynthesis methyltransferase [Anaerolineaceae bacterium]|nr:ubiquinone/menaquinone biosynthesis methyltransferase [Anaerolineaceae bacterium]